MCDLRNDASNREKDAKHAAIFERLSAVDPAKKDAAAGLEMAHDSTGHRASFVNNDELR